MVMLKTNKIIDLVNQVEDEYGSIKNAPEDDVHFLKIREMCDNSSGIKWQVTSTTAYTNMEDVYKAYLMIIEGYTRKYALSKYHVTPVRIERLRLFSHAYRYTENDTNRMVVANSQQKLVDSIAMHGLVGPTDSSEISGCIQYDSNYYIDGKAVGYIERDNFAKRLIYRDGNK